MIFALALALQIGCFAADSPAMVHRLQRGQTMASVARIYGVPLADLVLSNPGLDPHRLEVGTPLRVPVPPTGWPQMQVVSGDRASTLAQRGGFSLEALAALNPGADLERLEVGQTLAVPVAIPASPQPASAAPSEPASVTSGDWELVTLADGRRGWAPRALMLIPSPTPLAPPQVVELAQRFVGAPYRWGGLSPNGVDCSGFVQEVFRLSGHPLPRLADEQFQQTTPIDEPQLGDLVFFTTYLPGPSHVGISLGGQDFLHASSSRGVVRASLEDGYFKSRYLGAHRLPGWAQIPQASLTPGP